MIFAWCSLVFFHRLSTSAKLYLQTLQHVHFKAGSWQTTQHPWGPESKGQIVPPSSTRFWNPKAHKLTSRSSQRMFATPHLSRGSGNRSKQIYISSHFGTVEPPAEPAGLIVRATRAAETCAQHPQDCIALQLPADSIQSVA